jgi:type II secretory ATPase GspE/PulE/Tfp pilus assembly ATPase PilB-like protein
MANGDVPTAVYEAMGCDECASTGYRGRNGIFELLMVNEGVRQLILKRSSADLSRTWQFSRACVRFEKMAGAKCEGATSVAEVLRVTQDE